MAHGASTGSSLPSFPRIDKEKTSTRYLVVSRTACLFSEQRVFLRDFLGTRLLFSERMSEVASTPSQEVPDLGTEDRREAGVPQVTLKGTIDRDKGVCCVCFLARGRNNYGGAVSMVEWHWCP